MTVRLNARTLRAWQRTAYEAGGAVAFIGRRSSDIDRILQAHGARHGAFVTACNPRGRKMPPGWNARAMQRMAAMTRRIPSMPGYGKSTIGPAWQEAHRLLIADPRRAAVIANRCKQAGFVRVRRGGGAKLIQI